VYEVYYIQLFAFKLVDDDACHPSYQSKQYRASRTVKLGRNIHEAGSVKCWFTTRIKHLSDER